MYRNQRHRSSQKTLSKCDNKLHRPIFIFSPLAICMAATIIITNTSPATAAAAFGPHSTKYGSMIAQKTHGFHKKHQLDQQFKASSLSSLSLIPQQQLLPLHRREQSKLEAIHTYRPFSSSSSASSLGSSLFPSSGSAMNRSNEGSGTLFKRGNRGSQKRTSALGQVSSTMPHADIAVRLDQPILSSSTAQLRNNASTILKSMLTILLSDVAKTACVAFVLAFVITFLSKSSSKTISKLYPILASIKHLFKLLQGQLTKMTDGMLKRNDKEGVPLKFEKDDDGNIGWGVCTLSSKKKLGRSKFMEYEFKLPKVDNILNLALGQKITLCCLDNEDRVAKKDYYLYSPKNKKGRFSIIADVDGTSEDEKQLTKGEGDFSKVLSKELDVGDEIALQPGPRTLTYRGEYLPVTDMLYVASGAGIAPVLDQVKSVLPSGSSSVKSVTVIWTNDKEEDFDVALSSLEDEYFKYSTKLAVSCVVDENKGRRLDANPEIDEALPPFEPGTMAVIAGPKRFTNEARSMLLGYGYPEECICVLP